MIHLTIDNQKIEVQEGRTLLEACRENGFPIPTLCYHPALEPYGACRLCVVEITYPSGPSRLVASCTYPCEEGLQVSTESTQVRRSRRMTAELLLASAWNSPEIKALADEFGVSEARCYKEEADMCILCGLCVRACQEIVGISAISFIQRGIQKQVSPPFRISSVNCIGCGTCTLICPTHAIRLADITIKSSLQIVHQTGDGGMIENCQVCGLIDLSPHYYSHPESILGDIRARLS